MRVRNLDLWQAQESLQELMKEPWPVKTAYWMAKLARQINEQHAIVDQVRVKLITQYGTQNEQGQIMVTPGGPNWAEFAAAFNELMDETCELAGDKIVLPDVDGLRVSPTTLMALEPFVEVA